MSSAWDKYLTDADRQVMERGGFGRRMGFGQRAAVIVIDCQNYMVGLRDRDDRRYPSRCGPGGWQAVDRIRPLLTAARAAVVPVFYSKFELAAGGDDIGVYGHKRDFLHSEYWCLENTVGAEIITEIEPQSVDTVFVKKKPSAFHATPLQGLLANRTIDTLVIVGGATSNCIRATVFDAAANNYRAIVPADCVFDRIQISHDISLFDMDRQFADVVNSEDVLRYFKEQTSDGT
jgi:maleamate amidohydrolase